MGCVLLTATGDITNKSQLFATKLKNISFPGSSPDVFVVASRTEAIIVDRNNFQSKQKLSFDDSDAGAAEQRRRRQQQQTSGNATTAHAIKQMAFIPASDLLYGCFTNDSIHIWANCSFQLLRHVHPIKARDSYLKKSSKPIQLDLVSMRPAMRISKDENDAGIVAADDDNSFEVLLKSITKDYSSGIISAICFSDNGKSMCIGTIDDYVMLFSTDMWCIEFVLETLKVSVMLCAFVPSSKERSDKDSHCNTLAMQTSIGDVIIVNIDRPTGAVLVAQGHTKSVSVSKNGKIMAIAQRSGEIRLHSLDFVRDIMSNKQQTTILPEDGVTAVQKDHYKWVRNEVGLIFNCKL